MAAYTSPFRPAAKPIRYIHNRHGKPCAEKNPQARESRTANVVADVNETRFDDRAQRSKAEIISIYPTEGTCTSGEWDTGWVVRQRQH
jgi:hypothetical protein